MASQRQHMLGRILDASGTGTYNEETGRWSNCGTNTLKEDIRHDEALRLFVGRGFVKKALATHQMTQAEFDVSVHNSINPKADQHTQDALKEKMRRFLVSQGVKFVEDDKSSNSGWSFFGSRSKTVEDAEEHLQRWAAAILKKDSRIAQAEQRWFNDNDWTALEMKGSPPFYSRMVWKSNKLKKKIGVTIANGNANLDPPTNI